jgi:hypothetical protein
MVTLSEIKYSWIAKCANLTTSHIAQLPQLSTISADEDIVKDPQNSRSIE